MFGDNDRDRHRSGYGYNSNNSGNNHSNGNNNHSASGSGLGGPSGGGGGGGGNQTNSGFYDSSSNSSNSLKSDSPSRKRRRVSRLPSQSPPTAVSPRGAGNSLLHLDGPNLGNSGHGGLLGANHSHSLHLNQPSQPQLPSPPPLRRLQRENSRGLLRSSGVDATGGPMSQNVFQGANGGSVAGSAPISHLVHRQQHGPVRHQSHHHHVHHEPPPPPTGVHWPYAATPISICSTQIVPSHHLPTRTLASTAAAVAAAVVSQQQSGQSQVPGPSPFVQAPCNTPFGSLAAAAAAAAASNANISHALAASGQLHNHHHHHFHNPHHYHGGAQVHHPPMDHGLEMIDGGGNVRGLLHASPTMGHHHQHSVPHSLAAAAVAVSQQPPPQSIDIIHHPSSSSSSSTSRRPMPHSGSARRSHYATWVRWQNTGQNQPHHQHHHVHHTINRHSGHHNQQQHHGNVPHHRHHHHTFQRYQALAAAAGAASFLVSNPAPTSSGFLLNFLTLLPLSPYGQAELGSPDSPEENYEALLQVAERLGEVKPRGLGRVEIDQLCSYKFNADTHTGECGTRIGGLIGK